MKIGISYDEYVAEFGELKDLPADNFTCGFAYLPDSDPAVGGAFVYFNGGTRDVTGIVVPGAITTDQGVGRGMTYAETLSRYGLDRDSAGSYVDGSGCAVIFPNSDAPVQVQINFDDPSDGSMSSDFPGDADEAAVLSVGKHYWSSDCAQVESLSTYLATAHQHRAVHTRRKFRRERLALNRPLPAVTGSKRALRNGVLIHRRSVL